MRWVVALGTVALGALSALAAWLFVPWYGEPPEIAASGDPARGEYVLRLGGCVTCHTDAKNGGAFLAGGRALGSPFGTFYTSNITPDPATGIGGWSTGSLRARHDRGRLARAAIPIFRPFPTPPTPRRSSTIWSTSRRISTPSSRSPTTCAATISAFRSAFARCSRAGSCCSSRTGTFQPDPDRSEIWNRGAYIVNGPGHCSECHTPRNALGAPQTRPLPRRHPRRAGRQAGAQHHAA